MIIAFCCGVVGVGGLVVGSAMLVWESRLTLAILAEEAELAVDNLRKELDAVGEDKRGERS